MLTSRLHYMQYVWAGVNSAIQAPDLSFVGGGILGNPGGYRVQVTYFGVQQHIIIKEELFLNAVVYRNNKNT